MPVSRNDKNPHAYFLQSALIMPISVPGFTGDVSAGGACNCELLTIAPHGNGTHTECIGHISAERVFIKDVLVSSMVFARLVTVMPRRYGVADDMCISASDIDDALNGFDGDALIVRTLPNADDKQWRTWSGTNPPYFEPGTGIILRERGIKHFLCDVPSVDRESDGGVMAVHHEFWHYPESPRTDATISEMVYVADDIEDGEYLLHLAALALESDASPSTITLYRLEDTV